MDYVVFRLYNLSGVDCGVQRKILALSIGPNGVGLKPEDGDGNPVSETLFLMKKLNDG
jgi:hypothetical protein